MAIKYLKYICLIPEVGFSGIADIIWEEESLKKIKGKLKDGKQSKGM